MVDNKKIVEILKREYKEPKCELEFGTPYQLLVAVVLSAQCTDKRVNLVTKELFKKYPDAKSIATMPIEELENIIHPCGFFRNKARAIKSLSIDIIAKFNGEFPKTKEELKSLAGVGEKTANVVISMVYNIPAIAVDTHVFRVSNRLGLANAKTVEKTQAQLEKVLDRNYWSDAHYSLVLHGRYVCKAIKPRCEECAFIRVCKYAKNNNQRG